MTRLIQTVQELKEGTKPYDFSTMPWRRLLPKVSCVLCPGFIADHLVPSIIIKHAIDVERALCNFCGPESQAYKDKIRSLFQNLRQKGNPTLRQRVISGDITPEQFVRMKADELKSPERRAEDAALQRTNMNEAMVAKAEQSISNALECGKCKQKKVSYTQAQTRSADEPMTTFCHCTVCGNMWKVGHRILDTLLNWRSHLADTFCLQFS